MSYLTSQTLQYGVTHARESANERFHMFRGRNAKDRHARLRILRFARLSGRHWTPVSPGA